MGLLKRLFSTTPAAATAHQSKFTGDIEIYQIVHDAKTISEDNPLFKPLDNTESKRPDWYEYWPIRNHLLNAELDESALYGFLSPRFTEKTGLGSAEIFRFVESSNDADVYTFSPFPCHGAFFLNVFEQGNFFDPGSFNLSAEFFRKVDGQQNLHRMVNHTGTVVFSNFFLARPAFWREWLKLGESLFEASESKAIGKKLRQKIVYMKADMSSSHVERKIFLMERLATYLLTTSQNFRTVHYPIATLPIAGAAARFRADIPVMDALKQQYCATQDEDVLKDYKQRQRKIISASWPDGDQRNLLG